MNVSGDCTVMYEQCARPVNGIGPSKIFMHEGCRPQTGPNPGIFVELSRRVYNL